MNPLDPLGGAGKLINWLGDKAASAVTDVAAAPLNALAEGIADAVGEVLAALGTVWVRIDVPNIWNGSTTSGTVAALQQEVMPIVGFLAVLGIIIGGARLALAQRSQPGVDLAQGLVILALVTGAGVPMIALLVAASDAWAQSIVESATQGTDFGRNILLLVAPTGQFAPVLVVVFGLVALVVSGLQIVMLVFRAASLVLLAGLLPVAASMTMTQAGRDHFKRYVAWVAALAIYKPICALVYFTAFRLIGVHDLASGAGVVSVLIGLSLMLMAVLALPALLRFLVPAAGALHTSPQIAGLGAGGVLPKGARMITAATGVGAVSSAPRAAAAAAAGRGPSGARSHTPSGPSAPPKDSGDGFR